MKYRNLEPQKMRLNDKFYCRARRKWLELDKCLNDYMNANAFDRRRSACYRCPQGRRNREAFADGTEER